MSNLLGVIHPSLTKALAEVLQPNEQVLVRLQGAYKEVLVCTDKRLMIVKTGYMTGQLFGKNVFQLPYQNVTGVEVKFHLLTGYFEVSAGGMQNTPKSFWSGAGKGSSAAGAPNCVSLSGKAQANLFNEACTFILGYMGRAQSAHEAPRTNPSSLVSVLENLAHLRERGLITEAEFLTKKAEVLARL